MYMIENIIEQEQIAFHNQMNKMLCDYDQAMEGMDVDEKKEYLRKEGLELIGSNEGMITEVKLMKNDIMVTGFRMTVDYEDESINVIEFIQK